MLIAKQTELRVVVVACVGLWVAAVGLSGPGELETARNSRTA
jgi:hypothetical protein